MVMETNEGVRLPSGLSWRRMGTHSSSSPAATKRRRREDASGNDFTASRHGSHKRKRENSDSRPKIRRRSHHPRLFSHRKWVYSPRNCADFKDRFMIVSYNILGVENASNHLDLYAQIPRKYLNWDRRKKLICEELNVYKPSIICLQEVDRFSDLAEQLGEDGYRGVYKGRTGEACDGCAIFWKEKQFHLLYEENIEFQRFGLRNNVAQLCVFKTKGNLSSSSKDNEKNDGLSRTLLVGNTHMLFNPKRGDIKLGQARVLLEKAHALSQEWKNIPVVIVGDLNSMPQSALYQFLASSKLDILLHDRRNVSGQIESQSESKAFGTSNDEAKTSFPLSTLCPWKYKWNEEEVWLATGSSGCTFLQHHLKLSSAYLAVPGSSSTRDCLGEPLATSYHSKFLGTVDYIWHSEKLVPVKVVETIPISTLRKMDGLPSKKLGSDHLALVCELAFADSYNETNS